MSEIPMESANSKAYMCSAMDSGFMSIGISRRNATVSEHRASFSWEAFQPRNEPNMLVIPVDVFFILKRRTIRCVFLVCTVPPSSQWSNNLPLGFHTHTPPPTEYG